jgi:hypothetical protein
MQVPVPPGGAVPGAGGGAVALQASTYSARFRDAATDIFGGDYAALADQQRAEAVGGVQAAQHATLFNQLIRDSAHPTTLR